MKNIFLRNKSRILSFALKLMGVCGVLILFEACYGSPKSAFVPKRDLKKSTPSAHQLDQKEVASVQVK